jgi:phospholipase C
MPIGGRLAGALAVSFVVLGCGGDENDGGGPKGGTGGTAGAATGGTSSGGTGGTSATGGTGGSTTGGTGGGAGASGGTAGTGGSGGSAGATPLPYDEHANDRLTCKFTKGAKTTDTVGANVPHGDAMPFDHIVVLMQENRSFDHYFQKLPDYGVTDVDVAKPTDFNLDPSNNDEKIMPFHETRMCIEDVNHEWEPVHDQYNLGKMDGFVATNNPGGARAMGYYDASDFPFYYWMAKTYSIGDRFFSSTLGPTWPNRFFFYAGTAWGDTKTETVDPIADPIYKTEPRITDLMTAAGRSWKIYRDGFTSFATLFGYTAENLGGKMSDFKMDVQNGTLPDLVILDPAFQGQYQNDEHPPTNPQLGQQLVHGIYISLTSNPDIWKKTVFILIYDEHGGFYDHVPPPQACQPDFYQPYKYDYGRLGIRVPVIVVSPYVKAGYVSHFVMDLTSVTRFIENRFDLPAMTDRDANAWPMLDMFDFANPPHATPPTGAPPAVLNGAQQQWCQNNPPGTGKP